MRLLLLIVTSLFCVVVLADEIPDLPITCVWVRKTDEVMHRDYIVQECDHEQEMNKNNPPVPITSPVPTKKPPEPQKGRIRK